MASTDGWDPGQADPGPWPPAGYPAPSSWGYAAPPGYSLPAGLYLDPASGLVLPEGVRLASVERRIGAWFLAIPLSIVTLGIGYIVWGLVVWGRGQTPALQVLGMRCLRPQAGRVAGWWEMALREVVGGLVENLFSWLSLIGSFVLMLVTRDRKSLHDMVAGTVVVHDPGRVLSA